MNGICIKLIGIMLERDEWVTSSYLAGKLNVSGRSIKTYIAEINREEQALITSSQKGYRIDGERAKDIIRAVGVKLPQNSKERVNYIITRIFSDDATGDRRTDLFEIGEDIFVSYETIKKDMVKVRKKMMEFDLYISTTGACVSVEGTEADKRKLLSSILYDEFSSNVMSMDVIRKAFPGYDLETLQTLIQEKCKKFHYFVNEYALLNLVLDLVIGIYRIKNEKTFRKPRENGVRVGIRERELARNIASEIESLCGISYNPVEFDELTIILLSHLMKMDYSKIDADNLESVIGKPCMDVVNELRELLKNTYFIETDDLDFLVKFALHIKNLLSRLENGYQVKNPLLDHIKSNCPLIFECAVGASARLKELTGYELNEDEISYIALHIGGTLENQKSRRNRLSCTILYPQYYDFSNKMVEDLKKHYGDRIDILTVVTSVDQTDGMSDVDLLISTVPVRKSIQMDWVTVTPFLSGKDFDVIEEKIQKTNQRKIRERLRKHLMQISNPIFFSRNMNFQSKEEVIRHMTDIMVQEGYVDDTYFEEVIEREKQASTAFEYIAVPHSMKMSARKTGMFILVNEKESIQWGEQSVHIVLLFAVNKDERVIFHDVFDHLIVQLIEKPNAFKAMASESYMEFIDTVIEFFK